MAFAVFSYYGLNSTNAFSHSCYSAISVELYYIFATLWGREQYTLYGILFVVYAILLSVTACISVALTYFQLSNEDYRWWWRSIFSAGWVFYTLIINCQFKNCQLHLFLRKFHWVFCYLTLHKFLIFKTWFSPPEYSTNFQSTYWHEALPFCGFLLSHILIWQLIFLFAYHISSYWK